jgi:hypothetical protein
MTRIRDRLICATAIALFTCSITNPSNAQSEETEKSESGDFDEALDELTIDVANSIGDAAGQLGLSIDGDLRVGNLFAGDDFEDLRIGNADAVRARWRIRSTWGITERFRAVLRVAGICSTSECAPDVVVQSYIPTAVGMEDGQITIDEFFLQSFRSESFKLAIGRKQAKLVARGGVF